MFMTGIARIGNDPAIRFTPNNDPVLDLSLAFNYGKKGADGKYPTQWVNATLWGKRAESLVPYLGKGQKIFVRLVDVHIDNYTKKDGTQSSSLKSRIDDLELIDSKPQDKPVQEQKAKDFDDIKDDLPF